MTELRVTVRNTSEAGGTAFTPVYFGFHNGSFDIFNVGEAASEGLELLAEDGVFGPGAGGGVMTLADERLATQADSEGGAVVGATPAGGPGPIAADTVFSSIFDIDGDTNPYVSYAAMILPSNDAFFGTDDAVRLFDDSGNFIGASNTLFTGGDVYDAGTEVNTENNLPFVPGLGDGGVGAGVQESGIINPHQGYNGSEGNPVNILGGTTASGAVIDAEAGDFTRNGGNEQMMEIDVTAVMLADGTYDVTVSVTNSAPEGGTFLTPVFFGFHDGSFDLYDRGAAVSAGLESLAEDGATGTLADEFAAATGLVNGSSMAGAAPIAPQATVSQTLNVDPALVGSGYFTWASMVIPSNDAFLASPGNPLSDPIFDSNGNFTPLTVTRIGNDVLDAGTEVNNEFDAAFLNQTAPNTGVDQGGVVAVHQGFNGSDGSPVNFLPDEGRENTVNAFGQEITEAADFTRDGAQIAAIHINTVVTTEGSAGRDFVFGSAADDIVTGLGGRDILIGRDGYDDLDGGGGRDLLFGGSGFDILVGGGGNDKIFGGADGDQIDGGDGRDHLRGDGGDDNISGGAGRDFASGGSGDDVVSGGAARDHLFGGAGSDEINGGTGNDRLWGGQDADVFVFTVGDGRDRVADYDAGVDSVRLEGSDLASLQDVLDNARDTGRGVRIDYTEDDFFVLNGVRSTDLGVDDFTFV